MLLELAYVTVSLSYPIAVASSYPVVNVAVASWQTSPTSQRQRRPTCLGMHLIRVLSAWLILLFCSSALLLHSFVLYFLLFYSNAHCTAVPRRIPCGRSCRTKIGSHRDSRSLARSCRPVHCISSRASFLIGPFFFILALLCLFSCIFSNPRRLPQRRESNLTVSVSSALLLSTSVTALYPICSYSPAVQYLSFVLSSGRCRPFQLSPFLPDLSTGANSCPA